MDNAIKVCFLIHPKFYSYLILILHRENIEETIPQLHMIILLILQIILVLKENVPITLLRKLDPSNVFFNGTYLICRVFDENDLHVKK